MAKWIYLFYILLFFLCDWQLHKDFFLYFFFLYLFISLLLVSFSVWQAVIMVLESTGNTALQMMVKLLKAFWQTGLITLDQMNRVGTFSPIFFDDVKWFIRWNQWRKLKKMSVWVNMKSKFTMFTSNACSRQPYLKRICFLSSLIIF